MLKIMLKVVQIGWLLILASSLARAEAQIEIEARVVNVTPDGVYIDAGRKSGLKVGDKGILLRDAKQVAIVEVLLITSSSARLRISQELNLIPALADDRALIQRVSKEKIKEDSVEKKSESDLSSPLLAPREYTLLDKTKKRSRASNVFHGSQSFRLRIQNDSKNDQDSLRYDLRSRATLDRINGGPWALSWSWNASLRDGKAYDKLSSSDLRELDLYEFEFSRTFSDGSRISIGRALSDALPAIGYVDGIQFNRPISENVSLGGLVGLKPERIDLGFNGKEPLVAAYLSTEKRFSKEKSYWASAGLFASLYQGDADRLAFILSQRLRYNSLQLYWNSTVDLDVGGAGKRSGASLSELNASAYLNISKILSIRFRLDHNERLDTQAERAAYLADQDRLFDHGFWRYTIASHQRFSNGIEFDQQLSTIRGADSEGDLLWQLGISKQGLFSLRSARANLDVYNLVGLSSEGIGARCFASLPITKRSLQIQAGVGLRFLENDFAQQEFDTQDIFVNLLWRAQSAWRANLRLSHLAGDGLDANSLQFSVSYRW